MLNLATEQSMTEQLIEKNASPRAVPVDTLATARTTQGYAMHKDAVQVENLSQLVTDLFEEHAGAIRAYIYSLVRSHELSHDLTQEVFLQLYRTRARLRTVENRRAWLYRIASRVSFKEVRRRRRVAWLPWSTIDDEAHGIVGTTTADASMSAEVEQQMCVENALAELVPDQRATLLLYSRNGLSVREVAEALEIGESAVKMRLHRARQAFKQAYMCEADDTNSTDQQGRVVQGHTQEVA